MSRFLACVVSMGLLIANVSCAAVTASQLVRKEVKASGKMQKVSTKASTKACDSDMCNYDFPLGVDGSCDCKDPSTHSMIIEEEQCIEAAHEAGLAINLFTFVIREEYTHHHPKGCFKDSCTTNGVKGQCYFYNPIGGQPSACQAVAVNASLPTTLTGVPVCRRVNYLNGTVDGNGVDNNGGCAPDYSVVVDEQQCRQTSGPGGCLGYCQGNEFKVTDRNASHHNDFPMGCSIATGTDHDAWVQHDCVYFNPELPDFPNAPTDPHGTPICHVTVKDWKNGGGAQGTSAGNVNERATAGNATHWNAVAAAKANE